MASIDENSETGAASQLDRLEGEVMTVGGVRRPDALNDLNNTRADAATEALALYMEHKGQTRKLATTRWAELVATLEEVDTSSKPLIETVSITLEVREPSGETVRVQVSGREAEHLKEVVGVGDRIVGEGVKGEGEILLEQYDVYKLAS
jgi:hypothetical protein